MRKSRALPSFCGRSELLGPGAVASGGFFGEQNVPHQALTMGVGTILDAKRIVLLAFGEHKSAIVQKAVEGPVTDAIAASFLQQHADATFLLDPHGFLLEVVCHRDDSG